MALTFSRVAAINDDGCAVRVYNITMDNDYPAGGEAVAANDVGLSRIDGAVLNAATGYVFKWDQTNKKIMVFEVDVDAATDGPLVDLASSASAVDGVVVCGIFFGV